MKEVVFKNTGVKISTIYSLVVCVLVSLLAVYFPQIHILRYVSVFLLVGGLIHFCNNWIVLKVKITYCDDTLVFFNLLGWEIEKSISDLKSIYLMPKTDDHMLKFHRRAVYVSTGAIGDRQRFMDFFRFIADEQRQKKRDETYGILYRRRTEFGTLYYEERL